MHQTKMFTVCLLSFQYHFVKRVLSCLYHFLIFFCFGLCGKKSLWRANLVPAPQKSTDTLPPNSAVCLGSCPPQLARLWRGGLLFFPPLSAPNDYRFTQSVLTFIPSARVFLNSARVFTSKCHNFSQPYHTISSFSNPPSCPNRPFSAIWATCTTPISTTCGQSGAENGVKNAVDIAIPYGYICCGIIL
jgi:hypothetical protein